MRSRASFFGKFCHVCYPLDVLMMLVCYHWTHTHTHTHTHTLFQAFVCLWGHSVNSSYRKPTRWNEWIHSWGGKLCVHVLYTVYCIILFDRGKRRCWVEGDNGGLGGGGHEVTEHQKASPCGLGKACRQRGENRAHVPFPPPRPGP